VDPGNNVNPPSALSLTQPSASSNVINLFDQWVVGPYTMVDLGGIIDVLRRAAIDSLGHKSKSVGIVQLLIAGAHLPAIINQRGEFPT
jgi:hypothetical protein